MAVTANSKVSQLRARYNGEERWFSLLDDLGPRKLREGFIANGVTPAIAGAVVWFIDDQRRLERRQTDTSRTRYRRILAELDPDTVSRAIPGLISSPVAA